MESWTIHTFLPESSTQPFSSFCQPIGLKNQNAFLFTSLFLVVAIFRQRLWWKIGRFLSKVSGVQQKLRCMYFSGISFRGEMYPGNLWIPETIGVLFGKRVLPASNIPRFFVTSTVIHYLKQIRGEGFFLQMSQTKSPEKSNTSLNGACYSSHNRDSVENGCISNMMDQMDQIWSLPMISKHYRWNFYDYINVCACKPRLKNPRRPMDQARALWYMIW